MKSNASSQAKGPTIPGIAGIYPYSWQVLTGKFHVDGCGEALGETRKDVKLTRESWEGLLHPDDRGKIPRPGQPNNDESDVFEVEYRVRAESGGYRWFMDRGAVVEWDDCSRPCEVKGVLIDITNRKAAEETRENGNREALTAIKALQTEKESLLLGLRDLVTIFYLDPELRIVWTNRDLGKELNMDQGVAGKHCYALLHGRTRPCDSCTAVEALNKGELQEMENKLEDGRSFLKKANPIKASSGTVVGVIQVALNVTKHKQTEEGLKTTYQFLHSLLENSPTPILVTRRDGRIDIVNRAWERVFGFNREQVAAQLLHDIFPKKVADRLHLINKNILRSSIASELEESIDCPDGIHNFHTVRFPVQDATGETAAVSSISVDVTSRKQMERELTKREAELARKSRQLSEMNTALRVLLRQRDEDQNELQERIVFNVKELVLPYIYKLKKMHLNEAQMSYLEIVETHLNDIVTPFLRRVVSEYPRMTPKELQVAVLVREGKENKAIAELLNVSVNAVEIHRYNLRKKLGLQNKKINLRSYLLSLNELAS